MYTPHQISRQCRPGHCHGRGEDCTVRYLFNKAHVGAISKLDVLSHLGLGYHKGSFLATPPIRRGPFVDPTIIKLQF